MTRPAGEESPQFDDYGLSAFTFRPLAGGPHPNDLRDTACHTHVELEIHFVESGSITLDFSGREVRVEPGELLAFWGGIPHRSVDPEPPATVFHVAQVPIVNVLTWVATAQVLDRLLDGELLRSIPAPNSVESDRLAFARWSSDMQSGDQRLRLAAEIEIHARLLRLLGDTSAGGAVRQRRPGTATAGLVARTIQFVTRHFVEHITVADVARAVDRNHDHVMESFRRVCGLTLWDFVTRLRLSEAQRLLTTTDLGILAICNRSGFGSTSRMYEAFHRYCGQTPAAYRRHMYQ